MTGAPRRARALLTCGQPARRPLLRRHGEKLVGVVEVNAARVDVEVIHLLQSGRLCLRHAEDIAGWIG